MKQILFFCSLCFIFQSQFGYGANIGFSVSALDPLILKLAETQMKTIELSSVDGFEGVVDLKAFIQDSATLDKENTIKVQLTPSSVDLKKDQKVQVALLITSGTTTSTFESKLVIEASSQNAPLEKLSFSTEFSTTAIYEVSLMGGTSPESWSSTAEAAFRPHKNGLTLRFINRDPKSTHIVHGSGIIPHGDTNKPLAAANTKGEGGGIYEVKIPFAAAPKSGIYYCHVHENGNNARKVTANVPAP